MRLIIQKTSFDFIGTRHLYFMISGVLMAASIMSLAVRGLNLGIDFTGGSVVQIKYDSPMDLKDLRGILAKAGYSGAIPQQYTGTNSFAIRIKGSDNTSAETTEGLIAGLRQADSARTFIVEQKEYVGPTVGRHLYKQALFAIFFSMLGIVGYVAFRFSNPLWGLAGILALVHDVLVVLGFFALLQLEIDLVLVAAVLTIAGYSINDSIVVFDRMREKLRVMRQETLAAVLNTSINETLSRTIITSLTLFFTVITLFLIGGTVIHDFALALTIGVVVGTYSSIAIAAPAVYQWEGRKKTRPSAPVPHDKEKSPSGGSRASRRRRR